MDVQARRGLLDGAAYRQIGFTGVSRMNSALQADFDRATVPSLAGAAHDLVEREVVGATAQMLVRLALRKGAEGAAVGADIRVIDVAGDDVAHAVAAGCRAQRIGRRADFAKALAARRKQRDQIRLTEPAARDRMLDGGRQQPRARAD